MAGCKVSCKEIEMSGISNVEFEPEDVELIPTFETLELREELLRGIYACGFETPSVIQRRAIPPIVSGRDVIAQTHSGADKTATLAISLLQSLDTTLREIQVLVLTPTCESATNIQKVVRALGHLMDVQCHACIGGTRRGQDNRKLDYGQHVVCGTPGRVFDMINRNVLSTRFVKLLIFDDSDQMMNKGFKKHIYDVFRSVSPVTQVVLHSTSSTTDNSEIVQMIDKLMYNPLKVWVKRDELTLEGIQKVFVAVGREEEKFDTLCDLYDTLTRQQALVFCNIEGKVEWLAQKMLEADFTVSYIHGDMSQKKRNRIVKEFRSGICRLLISTHDCAGGIDVCQPSIVINYDAPTNRELYPAIIRRICKPARCGRNGVVVSFVDKHTVTE